MPVLTSEKRMRKADLLDEARAILNKADAEKRGLTAAERREYDKRKAEIDTLGDEIENAERRNELERAEAEIEFRKLNAGGASGPTFRDAAGKEYRAVRHGESFRSACGIGASELNIGRLVMANVTGNPKNLNAEERALYSQGTSVQGGFLLSPEQSSVWIDKLRAQSIVSQSGAMTLPLSTEETRVAVVSSDPTASWVSEGSTIPESEGTFSALILRSRALCVYSEVSLELIRNAQNAEDIINSTITAALAAGLDAACLSGTGAGEQPTGLLNVSTDQVIDYDVSAPMSYDILQEQMGVLWAQNCEPKTWIYSPALRTYIAKLKDGDGLPLAVPPEVQPLRRLTSTAVTSNDSYGVSYVGDFGSAIIGIRSGIEIQASATSGDVFKKKRLAIRGLMWGDFNAGAPNRIVRMHGITGL